MSDDIKQSDRSLFNNGEHIHTIRHVSLTQAFEKAVGKKVLILTPFFPFLIIGKIMEVYHSDFVFIKTETTHITELEGEVLRVHIDDINAFHIEEKEHPVPRIDKGIGHHNRGDEHC